MAHFMLCRLQLWCHCTDAQLLIIPSQALQHIATSVAVHLPKLQVHLYPLSSVY